MGASLPPKHVCGLNRSRSSRASCITLWAISAVQKRPTPEGPLNPAIPESQDYPALLIAFAKNSFRLLDFQIPLNPPFTKGPGFVRQKTFAVPYPRNQDSGLIKPGLAGVTSSRQASLEVLLRTDNRVCLIISVKNCAFEIFCGSFSKILHIKAFSADRGISKLAHGGIKPCFSLPAALPGTGDVCLTL